MFDATCEHGSWQNILAVLDKEGESRLNMLDPPRDIELSERVTLTRTYIASAYGQAHVRRLEGETKGDGDFASVFYLYISLLLTEGGFTPHPHRILSGVEEY